ncbi:hypothetical protein GC163_06220 [bacterium]|nr:hypothetical protein [bacterium]
MFLWLFRCIRNFISAVIALAGLLALAEVGLRVARFTDSMQCPIAPADSANSADRWVQPSNLTGFELPRWQRFAVTGNQAAGHWSTNSWGYRNSETVCPKPPDYYRVVCLGDEALLEPGLTDAELFPSQLQQRLQSRATRPIEVINAALPQACPLTMSIQWQHQLLALQPDLILVHISAEALARDRGLRRWVVRDAQGRVQGCINPATRPVRPLKGFNECRQEFALVDWCLTQVGQATPEESTASTPWSTPLTSDSDWQQSLEPLAEMADACRQLNIPCVVWCCPTVRSPTTAELHRAMLEQTSANALARLTPCVDTLKAITPEMVDAHYGWTAQGHQHLADYMATQLMTNLAGPWSSGSSAPAIQPVMHQALPTEMPIIQRAIR